MVRQHVRTGHTRKNRALVPLFSAVVIALLAAATIVISSIHHEQLHLDNASVWVTSLNNRKAARFNVTLKQADAAIPADSPTLDIAQSGNTTVLTDSHSAANISASTVMLDDQTSLPAGVETHVNGPTTAFFDPATGDVWATANGSIDISAADPVMRLGPGGKVAVTGSGEVFGYRPETGSVVALPPGAGEKVTDVDSLTDSAPLPADGFAVIQGRPVVLSGDTVTWDGGSAQLPESSRLSLQSTPVDDEQSGFVVVASPEAIYSVELAGKEAGKVRTLATSGSGHAATPVSVQGCVYAAWETEHHNYATVCSPTETVDALSLEAVSRSSEVVFRTNHRLVILNDVTTGNVWSPNDSTEVIRIGWDTIDTKEQPQEQQSEKSTRNRYHFSNDCSTTPSEISAQNDSFGARPGSSRILDVLRNDQHSDCSILAIEKVENLSRHEGVKLSPVYDGRFLQLTLTGTPSGPLTFTYSMTNGTGQASSATVTVSISENGNNAPIQDSLPRDIDVEQGASFTADGLDDFSDPDGDALTLVSASVTNTEEASVTTRSDGRLVFSAGSMTSGRAQVDLTVTDGHDSTMGTLFFTVKPANTLAPVIDPIVKEIEVGKPVAVSLKDTVHQTSTAPVTLTHADEVEGVTATASPEDFSVRITAKAPGVYNIPYEVQQGKVTATGMIRCDAVTDIPTDSSPIAVDDTANLTSDNTTLIEPLANDIDPLGGVLAVTSVSVAGAPRLRAGIIDHRRISVTAQRTPTTAVTITYTVANAQASATGHIIIQPPHLATPIAGNITASVRTNGFVTIPVMDSVSSGGSDVALAPTLDYDKQTFSGLAFVAGDTVRYQASDTAGTFSLTYTVTNSSGISASGTITLTVHARDAAHKAPPNPRDVEAQVAAGSKVRIPIPLTSIDRDGDGIGLLGLDKAAPALGRISEVGADYFVYEAYADSRGTDTFRYAVEDWTGQKAGAQIRVGIVEPAQGAGILARDDEIAMRPGRAVEVPVLLNDISEDGQPLHVDDALEVTGIDKARVSEGSISFVTPQTPGDCYVTYTARNAAGLKDAAVLRVHVDPAAPILPPLALDDQVPPVDTIGKPVVTVDLEDFVSNPSGTASELSIDIHDSARHHARMTGSTVAQITLGSQAQAIAYTVTNTSFGLTSTAFIQVPAYGTFPPHLRPKVADLVVNAGTELLLPLDDYVRVGPGKSPHITDPTSVTATQSDGTGLLKNPETLRFVAPKNYSGPASLTFEVSDSRKASDPDANTAVLTLPITVLGTEERPPQFSAPTVTVVAGEEPQGLSLPTLTSSPSGAHDYGYEVRGTVPTGFTATLDGTTLLVGASAATPAGKTAHISLSISYGDDARLKTGITLTAVESTKPLAHVPNRAIDLAAGESVSVNLFDTAYNPFPSKKLTVTDASTPDSEKIRCEWSPDGTVKIAATQKSKSFSTAIIFTVRDATDSPSREVSTTLTVTVKDVPDPPLVSPIPSKEDGRATLTWIPGSANGQPITEYEILWGTGKKSCGTLTSCVVEGLTNGTEYSFTVRARNEVGWSETSQPQTATPYVKPAMVENLKATTSAAKLSLSWTRGSDTNPITGYQIASCASGGSFVPVGTETEVTLTLSDDIIAAGACHYSVIAVNDAGRSEPQTGSAAVWTTPAAPPAPTVVRDEKEPTFRVSVGALDNATLLGGHLRSITVACTGFEPHDLGPDERSVEFLISEDGSFIATTCTASVTTDHGTSPPSAPTTLTVLPVTPTPESHFPRDEPTTQHIVFTNPTINQFMRRFHV